MSASVRILRTHLQRLPDARVHGRAPFSVVLTMHTLDTGDTRMRRLIAFSAAGSFFFGLHAALAQSPSSPPSRWSLELNADAAFPTRTVAGAELQTGGGVGFNVRYRFQPHLAAYAGWEWHLQQTDELSAGQTLDLNDNGYTLGLRFEHPLLASTAGWLRAGALINHIEVEDASGKTIDDTGHGLGWEGAVGLTFPVGQRFGVIPSVRYRSLSRDLTVDGVTSSATLSYVTAGLGFSIAFGRRSGLHRQSPGDSGRAASWR